MTTSTNHNILLVERSAVMRILLGGILQNAGYTVASLDAGETSLYLEAANAQPVPLVIIGSCDKPGEQVAVAKSLRLRYPLLAATPFLGVELSLEAGSRIDDAEQRQEVQFSGWIERPLNPQDILKQVAVLLDPDYAENAHCVAAEVDEAATNYNVPADCEIDSQAMQDLVNLGGAEFAAEIVDQFVTDGARILTSITTSIKHNDGVSFRESAHALRSCAANVGARGIYDLCLEWREADEQRLQAAGGEYAKRLEQQFASTKEFLQARYPSNQATG